MRGTAQNDVTPAIVNEWLPKETPVIIMETAEHGPFTYVLFRLNGVTVFERALQKEQGAAAFDAYRAEVKKIKEDRSAHFKNIEMFLASYKGVSHFHNLQMSLLSGHPPWSVGFAKLIRSPLPEIDTNAIGINAIDTNAGQTEPLQQWTRLYGVFLLDGIRFRTYTESVEAEKQELRIRDMDGDRRPEAKIVFKGVSETEHSPMKEREESSGYTAFILDCSDGHIQGKFDREVNTDISIQGTHGKESYSEVWRLEDINEDGHPDLNVVRRWTSEITYYDCEEDSPGPETVRDSEKDERQCLYRVEDDKWHCPPPPDS